MYPDFSYLFHDLFGSPYDNYFSNIKTYGFVLVVALGLSGWVFFLETKRKNKRGVMPSMVVTSRFSKAKYKLKPQDMVLPIMVIAAICGVLGARILSILESPSAFFEAPFRVFFVTGGMTFYGGFILAALCIIVYIKMHGFSILHFLDSAAPALFVGYGIGRLACHFSGDHDWGIDNLTPRPILLPDWLWAYDYPHNIAKAGVLIPDCAAKYCHVLPNPVWPTSVYECLMALIFFIFLWTIRKKINRPGALFGGFLILNGVSRFLIEFIRVNEHYSHFGLLLSLSQYIALGLIAIGIFLLFLLTMLSKRKQRS